MANEALKPCPFCASEASADGKVTYSKSHVKEQEWEQDTFYFCNCPTCGVSNIGVIGHRTQAEAIEAWNRRSTLSSDAVAGGEEVVSAWQFKHFDPISGHPVWKSTLYWNGHRSTEGRPLYASPPKLDQLRNRVKELEMALDRMLVPFEGDPCRKDHHGYCQSHFLEEDCCVAIARRVREGGGVRLNPTAMAKRCGRYPSYDANDVE